MLHNGKGERIRLHGIDCPEKRQAFGNRAKQFTSRLVFGKTVTVQVLDRDRYGRTVGVVLSGDIKRRGSALRTSVPVLSSETEGWLTQSHLPIIGREESAPLSRPPQRP